VNVGSRHVAVDGPAIRVYCSDDCLRGVIELDELVPIEDEPPRARARWWIAAGVVLGGTFVAVPAVWRDEAPPAIAIPLPIPPPVPSPAQPAVVATATQEQPPPQDEELLRELMEDAWIHPLAGPQRRMPINHSAPSDKGNRRRSACPDIVVSTSVARPGGSRCTRSTTAWSRG
jgi:hypothetical protein